MDIQSICKKEQLFEVIEKTNQTEIHYLDTKFEDYLTKKGNYTSLKASKEKIIHHGENESSIIYSTLHERDNNRFEIDVMIESNLEITHRIKVRRKREAYGLYPSTVHLYSKEELIMIKEMIDNIEKYVVSEPEIRLRKLFQPIKKGLYFYDLIEEELTKRQREE